MGHVAGGRGRTLGGTPGGVSARSDQPARHGEVADQFDLQIGRPAVTRRARIASLLAPVERRSLVGMAIVILALHVVGWGVLSVIVAPHSFSLFFFSSRRRHTRSLCDWSSDVCSSD